MSLPMKTNWRVTINFDFEDDFQAQVAKTAVTVNNSLQDYTRLDNHAPTYEMMTPGFKPLTV